MVGDDDAVVTVKKENLATVVERVKKQEQKEKERLAETAAGWVLPS